MECASSIGINDYLLTYLLTHPDPDRSLLFYRIQFFIKPNGAKILIKQKNILFSKHCNSLLLNNEKKKKQLKVVYLF